ncbi:hypothetical protein CI105_09145 [Candidatus Izimaplasma bacterium ZiA1]|uniref:hypothetical protein n=1 Tax=Candidatus Izimoplasma sp. ZiA1 TaxID=2024899 RepID=UPI000BAA477A|nr:hypothetical protein CI105_09145 [Candidatus Izimaplasma bacterium ZiA1]
MIYFIYHVINKEKRIQKFGDTHASILLLSLFSLSLIMLLIVSIVYGINISNWIEYSDTLAYAKLSEYFIIISVIIVFMILVNKQIMSFLLRNVFYKVNSSALIPGVVVILIALIGVVFLSFGLFMYNSKAEEAIIYFEDHISENIYFSKYSETWIYTTNENEVVLLGTMCQGFSSENCDGFLYVYSDNETGEFIDLTETGGLTFDESIGKDFYIWQIYRFNFLVVLGTLLLTLSLPRILIEKTKSSSKNRSTGKMDHRIEPKLLNNLSISDKCNKLTTKYLKLRYLFINISLFCILIFLSYKPCPPESLSFLDSFTTSKAIYYLLVLFSLLINVQVLIILISIPSRLKSPSKKGLGKSFNEVLNYQGTIEKLDDILVKSITNTTNIIIKEHTIQNDEIYIFGREKTDLLSTNWPSSMEIKTDKKNDKFLVNIRVFSKGTSFTQSGNTRKFLSLYVDNLGAYLSNNEADKKTTLRVTDKYEELKKLKELLDEEIISKDEFEKEKHKIFQ